MRLTENTEISKRRINKELLARLGGFEPSTYRFVAGHSIH